MRMDFVELAYLVAVIGFALSLRWMTAPSTARRGVLAGEIAFAIAIIATLINPAITGTGWFLIIVALALGTLIGIPLGLRVPMTAMPERIALSHAFGALAAGLVGIAHFYLTYHSNNKFETFVLGIEIVLGCLVFTGSLMASGKLQEMIRGGRSSFAARILQLRGLRRGDRPRHRAYVPPHVDLDRADARVLGLVFGVLLIVPIGGADMPVVISLLNCYAGLSASAMGIVLDNKVLIIAGALDGTGGLHSRASSCAAR